MLLDGVPVDAHDVLALVVVDQVQVLQRRDDVLLFDGGAFADVAEQRKYKIRVYLPTINLN